jgi:DNA polymerase-1
MSKKLYILDVSGYIFRAYFALPAMRNSKGEPTHALFGFIRSCIKLFKEFGPDHIVAVFDGPDNKKQRKEIYEKYKANRIQKFEDLPSQIDRAKEFCILSGIATLEVGGVEADDTMGSVAKWASSFDVDVLLCTADKDLCQMVDDKIKVLNTWKDNLILDRAKVEEVYGVPPELIVDLLAIMGDSSDNIPGIKGFGPKTTTPLLKEFGSLENLINNSDKVKSESKRKLLQEGAEDAFLSKRLATIYTDVDFPKDDHDFFKKQSPDIAALRTFYQEMGFNSLARELEALLPAEKSAEKNYVLVDDEESLKKLVELLSKHKEICFDAEATDIHPLKGSCVGIGFCVKEAEGFYVPMNGNLGKQKALAGLRDLFQNPDLHFYGHNVKYDAHILQSEGIKVSNLSFDTILASYLLRSDRRHSLDSLALEYFGKVKIAIKDLLGRGKKEITMDQVPIEKVCEYCCEDVDYTFRLKELFSKELEKRGLTTLLTTLELPLSKVLFKMERAGVFVDVEHLKKLSDEFAKELESLTKQIYLLAGEEFNISSPKQLSTILFEKLNIKSGKKTATGFSTSADVLEMLSREYEIARKIIEYRTLDKLKSTYLDTLPLEVNPKTHRIHPTFNQSVAATGRLSCQDPNLQNIPTRGTQGKKIREAFRPQRAGWSFLGADYSQIELRLLAHLSSDENLIRAFQEGQDIHRYTASLIFNLPLLEITSEQRHHAKAINFGIVYGQQAYGLSQEIGIDIREAAKFIEAYFQRYPAVYQYMQSCIASARKSGKTITMTGREREISDIHAPNASLRAAAERLAINTPLQGSAADLIKLAMLEIDRLFHEKKFESFMILQIHDELIFEVKDEEIEAVSKVVKAAMEGVFSLQVPLIVDLHIGKNWGEC